MFTIIIKVFYEFPQSLLASTSFHSHTFRFIIHKNTLSIDDETAHLNKPRRHPATADFWTPWLPITAHGRP
jgi:hypothetical protein